MASRKTKQVSQQEGLAELRTLVQRAKSGDRTAVPRLREYLRANPNLWKRQGNLAIQTQASLIKLIAGPDGHFQECLALQISQLKADLAGKAPTSLETLVVERIITNWLQLGYVESREAQCPTGDLKLAQFQLQRQVVAERQLRGAIGALMTLREVAARKTITVELRPQAEASKVAALFPHRANGSLPVSTNSKPCKPNGVNRINGVLGAMANN